MHRRDGKLIVSATDLVGFLECGHLSALDLAVANGELEKPFFKDATLDLIRDRGGRHEGRYIEQLRESGRTITDLSASRDLSYAERAAETIEAMRRGDDVIYQGMVFDGKWIGYPDFLLRVDGKSDLGDWHYEVADTKLAHSAKASALIQICSYVDQIERIQGVRPEKVYVVTGGAEIGNHAFRTAEMMAYYRHAKQRFEQALEAGLDHTKSYPDPVEHCGVCRWQSVCDKQWHADDALPIVAGITRSQRTELKTLDVTTRGSLAIATGLDKKFERVANQARLQVESDDRKPPKHELLPPESDADGNWVADRGLSALPEPAVGDLFFDIEGDPFALWEGLEYLFGMWDGDAYEGYWALDREEEKREFERVIDLFTERRVQNPDMHVYHFGSYEPSHLKRLAGRHATREEELDQLLRGRVFVDLYRVVRQGLRAGVESYSIKKLESLYGYDRTIDLREAGDSIVEFEMWLDGWLEDGIDDKKLRANIEAYNRDDCVSTLILRDWLESLRGDAAQQFGRELPRPSLEFEGPKEEFTQRQAAVKALEERLTAAIPKDPTKQSPAEKATWLMRHLLDWHRRENKASWWRFYELMSLSEDDLVNEAEPIGQLEFVERIVREGKGVSTDYFRYRFPPQEHKIDVGNDVHDPEITEGKTSTGTVAAVDDAAGTVDIKRSKKWDGRHPEAIVPLNIFGAQAQQDALMRIGTWIADNGIESQATDYQAVRDLLLRLAPRVGQDAGAPLTLEGESGSGAALRLAGRLGGTTLAIQGPPGSGKTFHGARMILALVAAGKRVGVTANSHKVIGNLVEAVLKAGDARVIQKAKPDEALDHQSVRQTDENADVADALAVGEVDIAAGTPWLWARDDMTGLIDTLFVDEAGQMSLANVVAMGGSARNIVLLGDPQQLDQPTQGVHPDGAGVSALAHVLGRLETVPSDRGLFLEKTWRMHPAITAYTSDLFYEGKLKSVEGLERQEVLGSDWLAGSGLRWVPVEHDGNTNESPEEAAKVAEIWKALVGRSWIDRDGAERTIGPADIVIVSPFNAHRLSIQKLLPSARVGTVDKFQGQEAAVSIYTMATSRPEDAPRGMAFLYSLNRLNVATSRALALAIIVASPVLLAAVARTPDQLRMANGVSAVAEGSERGRVT
jgi:predicted RecB family nuclease